MHYYNEIDSFAADWLRNLMKEGLIPLGYVDERSVTEVRPEEIDGFTSWHFFAGIGGWAYALRLAGWPDDRPVVTGSCPCQPFSVAGKRKGTADERHLWPEMRRLIGGIKPAIAIGEQVASKDGREWLAGVQTDLEALGFEFGAADLCSAGIAAPNIRQRLYWVAKSRFEHERRRLPGSSEGLSPDGVRPSDQFGRSDDVGRMGEPILSGLEGYAGDGGGGNEPGRLEAGPVGSAAETGAVDGLEFAESKQVGLPGQPREPRDADVWMGEPDSGGRETGQQASKTVGQGDTSNPTGIDGRLADTDGGQSSDGDLQRSGEHRQQPEDRRAGYWDDYDIVYCRDGKQRRVISGAQLVASGLPTEVAVLCPTKTFANRTNLLKGIGNAINAKLAAEFVRAVMESI